MRLLVLALLLAWSLPGHASDPREDLLEIPAGLLQQGDPEGAPDEVERRVSVAAFSLMRHEVTNAQFATFELDCDRSRSSRDSPEPGTGHGEASS